MFEGIISDLLNRVLGKYIENLDCSKLKIGIWGGDVMLKDLVIKQSALDELGWPVRPTFGHLKYLSLKIPWSKMYTEKWEATIDGLTIVVVPSSVAPYDQQKEEDAQHEEKIATLARIEEVKKIAKLKLSGKETKQQDGFQEKLIAQVIRNIQIKITNIHIRYEDSVTCSTKPFAAGFVMQNLSLQSTDKSWNIGLDTAKLAYKLLTLDGFLVYWSPNSKILSQNENVEEVRTILYDLISDQDSSNLKPVFGPLNLTAKLQLNPHPETDDEPFSIPKILLNITLMKLTLGLSRYQYEGMMSLLDSIESMKLSSTFRKYRPNVDVVTGNAKLWWKYAYQCKLEDIRRMRRNWSWSHINLHRRRSKRYIEIYKLKMSGYKLNQEQKEELANIERTLDVFNITLTRKQAEMELEREGKTKAESQSKRGWFGGWLSWKTQEKSSSEDEDSSIVKKIEAEMTPEEKDKFYEAIGYCEEVPNEIPVEFVDFRLSFLLDELQFTVQDELLEGSTVLVASTGKVFCNFSKRSAASAVKIESSLRSFDIKGYYEEKLDQPLLVESVHVSEEVPLLNILFETNPIGGECDTRIHVDAQPLDISYHSSTIAIVTDLFAPPKNISLQQLQAAALTRLEVVKEKSVAGLQAAIDNHNVLDLNINVKSSKIILPEYGFFKPGSSVIVVNLGSILVTSKPRENFESLTQLAITEQEKEAVLERMRNSSYDRFNIYLENVQVVIAEKDDDWSSALTSNKATSLHLLQPLSLNVDLYNCLISGDPNLPKKKVDVRLPKIHITVIDKKLTKAMIIANNCFNSNATSPVHEQNKTSQTVEMDQNQNVLTDEVAILRLESEGITLDENRQKATQFIDFVFSFTIEEMTLELLRAEELQKTSVAILKVVASELALELTMRTFDLDVNIVLRNLSVYHLEWGVHPILTTISGSELPNQQLLNIRILQVSPKNPDLQLVHNFVILKIDVEMSKLSAKLDQNALLSILAYANNIEEAIYKEMPQNKEELVHDAKPISVSKSQEDSKTISTLSDDKRKVSHKDYKQNFAICIGAVELFISKGTLDLFTFFVKGLTVDIVKTKQKTEIKSCLERCSFVNSAPDALHDKILIMEDGNAWDACIEIEERSSDTEFFDVDKFDVVVKVEIGTPKIVFLNKTLNNILSWINNFQSATEKIVNASQAAAEAAKQNIRDAFSQGWKLKLDLLLKAPVIYIPHNSTSTQGVLLDLGKIIISNHVELGRKRNELGHPYVLDNIGVEIQNIKISRRESLMISQEVLLLQPFSVRVNVIRNLSISWFKDLPEIAINGSLETIQMEISEDDMSSFLSIVEGNLGETTTIDSSVPKSQVSDRQVKTSASDKEILLAEHGKIYKKLSFQFTIKDVSLTLFTSDARHNFEGLSCHKEDFAKFSLRNLRVKFESFSDFSSAANLLLYNCVLEDVRKDETKKITTMVEKKNIAELGVRNSLLDVTFHQGRDKNIFLDVKISEIVIIIHLPFLLRMKTFLTVESFKDMTEEDLAVESMSIESERHINECYNQELVCTSVEHKDTTSSTNDSVIAICIKLEEPDIVLVDDLSNIDSSCIFLHGEIQSAIKISSDQRNVTANVKNLQMYTSVFNPVKRSSMLSQILMKSDISFVSKATSRHAEKIQLKLGTFIFNLSPDTLELVMRILSCLSSEEDEKSTDSASEMKDLSNLWNPKPIDFSSLPNLHIESAEEVPFDFHPKTPQSSQSGADLPKSLGGENIFVEVECLIITLESYRGTLSMPLIKIQSDCSLTAEGFFSPQMTFDGHVSVEIAYYNHRQAIWEPLLEPVEKLSPQSFKMEYQPWKINFEGHLTLDNKVVGQKRISPILLSPTSEGMEVIEFDQPQPLTKLSISAQDPLEFTVTKTFLELLTMLSESFMDAYKGNLFARKISISPYKFINKTGLAVSIKLRESRLQLLDQNQSNIEKVLVKPDGVVDLMEVSSKDLSHRRHSSLLAQFQTEKEKLINIQIAEAGVDCFIPVTKSDKRYFPITPTRNLKEKLGLVASVVVEEGCKIITLSGCVKVTNELDTPLDIYYLTEAGNAVEHVLEITPNQNALLPLHAIYTQTSEIFFAVKGYSVCINPLVWKGLQNYPKFVQNLNCQPNTTKNPLKSPFFFCASCEVEQIFWKNTSRHTLDSVMVTINLKPCVVINNLLPADCYIYPPGDDVKKVLRPGTSLNINNAQLGSMYLEIEILNYQGSDWKCGKSIESNPQEFNVWTFKRIGKEKDEMTLDLGLRVTAVKGVHYLYLYCPFWIVNKTGFDLEYKVESFNAVYEHKKDFKDALLFSFGSRSFFGKKKAFLRVQDSEWSQKFPLDAVGSAAAVSCRDSRNKNLVYQVSINIQLSSSGLTKIVTFTPFYKVINQCPYDLQFCLEEDILNEWKPLPSGDCVALWPFERMKTLKLKVDGTMEKTEKIHFDTSHSTLFKLKNKYGGVFVDVFETEGGVLLKFDKCIVSASSALILNHLRNSSLTFWQEDQEDNKMELGPQQMTYFTWDSAGSRRLLLFSCMGFPPITLALNEDKKGSIGNGMAGWAIWMEGAQRYLIVSEDETMLECPSNYQVFEQVRQEVEVSFNSIGLSVINDIASQEIMYLSLTSSGIVWENRKEGGKKYRPFTEEQTILLEKAYLMYSAEAKAFKENVKSHFLLKPMLEVDFALMKVFKPFNRPIRRVFQQGVWMQLRIMSSERNFHLKINKIQLDNQISSDVMFPVVLSRVPPSKSVMAATVPKPFFEMSIIMSLDSPVYSRFKYFSMLIQEFHLKVELPFIYRLLETLFKNQNTAIIYSVEEFEKDSAVIHQNIAALAMSEKHPSRRDFYHHLHLSPIKMHLSFSLTGMSDSASEIPIGGQVIHLFLQSVGVTLTEIQDVVFRLAFFEKQNCWLNKEGFQTEVISHYTNQIIKQLYVLVLGLDVLGNPFGLVLGVTKGFGDLFYEPIQGAVEGPTEFAEGIVYGVRSFVGKTVGGAAGAFSRITGTIGKGMASLTLDDEYQRNRREEMHKKPADGLESFARSSKGVFTGVLGGVTGVFTKPISGAKEEGVEGFFKGVGKGVIGLVTRPASGVIDFASGSFDAIMRATDSTEDGIPIRPPRYIKVDGIIRPYERRQATGSKLLKELHKGQFSETDVYASHAMVKDSRSILLASDKRLFLISKNDLLGQWKIEWIHCYDELEKSPARSAFGIKLTIKETKTMFGVFSSSGNIKEVTLQDPSVLTIIFEEISEAYMKFHEDN